MRELPDQDLVSLRAAIAWALYLADAQGDTVIAAHLADALRLADKLTPVGPT